MINKSKRMKNNNKKKIIKINSNNNKINKMETMKINNKWSINKVKVKIKQKRHIFYNNNFLNNK